MSTFPARPLTSSRPLLVALATMALAAAPACVGSDDYVDDWGQDDLAAGKADGLLDAAPELRLDQVATGYVEGTQLDLYAIELRAGSTIRFTEKVTQGNLAPHFLLYRGATTTLRSDSFSRTGSALTKTYRVGTSGRHYVAVRAYQGQGRGRYSLQATCAGGACGSDSELDAVGAAACIEDARTCALDALPAAGGAVGPARARAILDGCLARTPACRPVCTAVEGGPELCAAIVRDLQVFADHGAACRTELDRCFDECLPLGEDQVPDLLADTAEGVCWEYGLNGTCPAYARSLSVCGGQITPGSNEACHALCEATQGAWIDDLDLLCVEACD